MTCQAVDPGNPYLWIFLTGCFFGITLAQMTISPHHYRDPGRSRARKWAWVYIFASLFMAAGLAGFFIAGWQSYTSIDMVYYGLTVAGVSALAFRFKKGIGVAVLLLFILFIVYFGFITSKFSCTTEDGDTGWFRMLEYGEGTFRVEAGDGGDTRILEGEGSTVTPVVSALHISRHYILFGGRTLYLLNGIYPRRKRYTAEEPGGAVFHPDESPLTPKRIAAFARRFPGIQLYVLSIEPFRPPLFQRYRIILDSQQEVPALQAVPIF